jgi:hypothetical protein
MSPIMVPATICADPVSTRSAHNFDHFIIVRSFLSEFVRERLLYQVFGAGRSNIRGRRRRQIRASQSRCLVQKAQRIRPGRTVPAIVESITATRTRLAFVNLGPIGHGDPWHAGRIFEHCRNSIASGMPSLINLAREQIVVGPLWQFHVAIVLISLLTRRHDAQTQRLADDGTWSTRHPAYLVVFFSPVRLKIVRHCVCLDDDHLEQVCEPVELHSLGQCHHAPRSVADELDSLFVRHIVVPWHGSSSQNDQPVARRHHYNH